jgi:hypothetical protein
MYVTPSGCGYADRLLIETALRSFGWEPNWKANEDGVLCGSCT